MEEEKQLDPLQSFVYGAGETVGGIQKGVEGGLDAAGDFIGEGVETTRNAGRAVGDFVGNGVEAVQDFGKGVAEYWGGMPALAKDGYDAGHGVADMPEPEAERDPVDGGPIGRGFETLGKNVEGQVDDRIRDLKLERYEKKYGGLEDMGAPAPADVTDVAHLRCLEDGFNPVAM